MLRTIIGLNPNEKSWPDKEALIEHVSMAEIVKKAIRHYRLSIESQKKPGNEITLATKWIARYYQQNCSLLGNFRCECRERS